MSLTEEQESAVELKILKHKADLKNNIRDAFADVNHLSDRLELLESDVRKGFRKSELQRTSFSDEIKAELNELKVWFKEHDGNEMAKYDEILNSIKNVVTTLEAVIVETKENSNYISQKAHEDSIDEEVSRRLAIKEAPMKDLWIKVRNAVAVLIALAVFGALGTGILFVYDLYKKMGG